MRQRKGGARGSSQALSWTELPHPLQWNDDLLHADLLRAHALHADLLHADLLYANLLHVDALHADLARRHDCLILGASRPYFAGPRPVNRATLYGPDGILGHQDKQIMTRFEREQWDVVAGSGLVPFDTDLGRIGVIICYDSEFPLLARHLVDQGAEILLAPSCTDSLAGFTRVRIGAMARALENQCVVAQSPTVGLCDFCPAVDENVGSGAIYGPPDLGFPPTGILAETPLNTPGWALADVSLEAVRLVRRDGRVLNHRHWSEQGARIAAAGLGPESS